MTSRLTLLARLSSGMNGLLGAAIMFSPLVSGHAAASRPDAWAGLGLGGIIMTFGVARLLAPEEFRALSWANLALGACILVSPWLLRFASNDDLMWAGVAVGTAVMVLAGTSARVTELIRQKSFARERVSV